MNALFLCLGQRPMSPSKYSEEPGFQIAPTAHYESRIDQTDDSKNRPQPPSAKQEREYIRRFRYKMGIFEGKGTERFLRRNVDARLRCLTIVALQSLCIMEFGVMDN